MFFWLGSLERPCLLALRLAIAKVAVFVGSQADVLFHCGPSLWRRFSVRRLILFSSAFRIIASVFFVFVVRLRIPLSHTFGYADPIVHFSRVCRATIPSAVCFSFHPPVVAVG